MLSGARRVVQADWHRVTGRAGKLCWRRACCRPRRLCGLRGVGPRLSACDSGSVPRRLPLRAAARDHRRILRVAPRQRRTQHGAPHASWKSACRRWSRRSAGLRPPRRRMCWRAMGRREGSMSSCSMARSAPHRSRGAYFPEAAATPRLDPLAALREERVQAVEAAALSHFDDKAVAKDWIERPLGRSVAYHQELRPATSSDTSTCSTCSRRLEITFGDSRCDHGRCRIPAASLVAFPPNFGSLPDPADRWRGFCFASSFPSPRRPEIARNAPT